MLIDSLDIVHTHDHTHTNAQGKYKDAAGSALCGVCQANATPSAAQDSCLCLGGYELIDQECLSCPHGSYSQLGDASCVECAAGKHGTSSRSRCQDCVPGTHSNASGTVECSDCKAGTFSANLGSSFCGDCPPNADSRAGESACTCRAGYATADGGACQACPAGKYREASSETCEYCSDNAISPAGSTEPAACQCRPGYTRSEMSSCVACADGTYKTSAGDGECSSCPANSSSPSAATSVEECRCIAGYLRHDTECQACPRGTYKAPGGAECQACPANSDTARPASASASMCVCNAGFLGAPGEACVNENALSEASVVIRFAWTKGFSGLEADQKLTVDDGQVVEFAWQGNHNVYLLRDQAAFGSFGTSSCDWTGAQLIDGGASSGVRYTFSGTGRTLHFGCKVGTHCQMGQKLAVTIGQAVPSPLTSPTTAPPPPPSSSTPASMGGLVAVEIRLPMSAEQFRAQEVSFVAAIADAAGPDVTQEDVVIKSVR